MKKIKLTHGIFTLVDNEDYDYLNQWKWHVAQGYARRTKHTLGNRKSNHTVSIHNLLMKPITGMVTDHINGNKLDNRKENLRVVTRLQNQMNKLARKDNKCGYSGVYFHTGCKKWIATLRINGKSLLCKSFKELDDAVLARKVAEDIYFGEYKRKS